MTNNRFTNEQLEYFSAAACEIINRGVVTTYERAASKVIIRLVAELQERRKADTDRLQESAYKAGLTAGWNFGIEHNSTDFSKCLVAHEYTASPAPVVPDEKRDEDGNITSEFDRDWGACRAAMLQGAEPVSQPYKLPEEKSASLQLRNYQRAAGAGSAARHAQRR